MDMKKIACFLKVAEKLSFAAAARELYITPQALTQQIARMETELGIKLFDRNTRTVVLTEGGHFVYEQLAPAKKSMDLAIEAVREHAKKAKEQVRIGFFNGLPKNEILNPCLSSLAAVFSIEQTILLSGNLDALMSDFQEDRIDILITNVDELFPLTEYEVTVLRETPALITVSHKHPWAAKASVTEDDMAGADMVQFNTQDTKQGKGFYTSVPCQSIRRVDDFDAMLAMIESGAYFGIFPDTFDSSRRALFRYFPPPGKCAFLYRTICACKKDNRNSKIARAVLQLKGK